jgi:16S rRNA (cytosine967-C5)-methyltransferase
MPQDEAAQIISHWLQAEEGDQILDACAAPGGKTTHIAALSPKATITALDLHAHKLSLLQQLCHRLRIPVGYGTAPNPITDDDPHLGNSDTASYVRLMLADATQPLDAQYDRIICDAPCSGLGIIRKQPEIRYRRNQSDIQQCAKLQLQLLNNLARCLRSGGTLLYSVCTDTFEENEQIIEKFLCQNPSFRLDPAVPAQAAWGAMIGNDGFLRTSPEQHDLDAFFAARLTKL